jgi:hypothetical protein
MFMKLLIFRCKLPSGISLLSLPHSHENTHPLGAVSGRGGIGLRSRGSCVFSFSQAPFPRHAVNLQKVSVDEGHSKWDRDLQLTKERSVDGSYDRLPIPEECNGHAVEWTEMDEVDGSCTLSALILSRGVHSIVLPSNGSTHHAGPVLGIK